MGFFFCERNKKQINGLKKGIYAFKNKYRFLFILPISELSNKLDYTIKLKYFFFSLRKEKKEPQINT